MDLQEAGWGRSLDWSGLGEGKVAGSCECGNETSGCIQYGKFLDWLRNC